MGLGLGFGLYDRNFKGEGIAYFSSLVVGGERVPNWRVGGIYLSIPSRPDLEICSVCVIHTYLPCKSYRGCSIFIFEFVSSWREGSVVENIRIAGSEITSVPT